MPASGIHDAMPSGNMRCAQVRQDRRPIEVTQRMKTRTTATDAHALLLAAQDLAPQRMGIVARSSIDHRPARLASGCPRVEDMLGNRRWS